VSGLRQLLASANDHGLPSAARLACVLVLFVGGSLLGVFVATSSASPLHSSGCHAAHSCPSDHHTYVWFDGAGEGWDCAEPGAREVTGADTTSIVYEGLTYLCHAAGVAPSPRTTTVSPPPATTTAASPTATAAATTTTIPAETCGVERWDVKTLSDAAATSVNYTPAPATVTALRALPTAAVGVSTPRIAGPETTTYTIQVRLVSMKFEDDKDIHLVVADLATGQTMIVEFPNPNCRGAVSSPHLTEIASARAALISAEGLPGSSFTNLVGTATITGVGFVDVLHGQTGVAPNGIELHPAIAFSAGTSAPSTTVATTTAAPTTATTTPQAATTAIPRTTTRRPNAPPRIVTVRFGEATRGSGRAYAVIERVQFKACDDARGTLVAELAESKSAGEQLLAKSRRVKRVTLSGGCTTSLFTWKLAPKFFGVGNYVISLRVRDAHGAWSGARTHRSFTSD
jgi:hypothetical protein